MKENILVLALLFFVQAPSSFGQEQRVVSARVGFKPQSENISTKTNEDFWLLAAKSKRGPDNSDLVAALVNHRWSKSCRTESDLAVFDRLVFDLWAAGALTEDDVAYILIA